MKRFPRILFGISILVLMAIGNACNKDSDEKYKPSIILVAEPGFIANDTMMKAGEDMTFKIVAMKGSYNLTEFYIEVISDKAEVYFDTGNNASILEWSGTFKKTFAQNEQWNFIVRGRHGLSESTTINIKLDTSGSFGEVINYPIITLGAQNGNLPGLYSFMDSTSYSLDQANNSEENQKKIELLYYYQSVDLNVISSPGANIEPEVFNDAIKNWTFRNTTRFMPTTLTVAEFNSIANDSIIIANYNEADGKRKAKLLQTDDIYSFKTNNDKLGVFLVKNVSGAEQGSIEIELKIQK